MGRRLPYEEVKRLFEEVRGFELIETNYINSETPMKYRCTCGNISHMSYKNAKKGRNCRECGRKKLSKAKQIYTFEYISEFFIENGCTLLETEYKADPHYRMEYICVCGTHAEISWSDFNGGSRCKTCRTRKVSDARRKYSIEELRVTFAKQGKYLLEENFSNSSQLLKYFCKCGSESEISLNNFHAGKDCYSCRNKKISDAKKDPNITDEERLQGRNVPEIRVWRAKVYERDDFTCQCCQERSGRLNAHHIYNYADNREVRFEVSNGITFCEECHTTFHKKYGWRNTNKQQLDEYLGTQEKDILGV